MGGCSVGPDFRVSDNGLDQAVLSAKDQLAATTKTTAMPVPQAWWSLFNDPILDALIAQAWSSNLDLQASAARLLQSRAQAGIAASGAFPRIGVEGKYARNAISEAGPLVALGASPTPDDLWQVGFDASWELDLWNRQGRIREGALAQSRAVALDNEFVRVSVAAEIAQRYLNLRGVQEQEKIAEQNLDVARHTVRLAESRQSNGVGTRFDVASARAQLAEVGALLPTLRQQQNQLMNSLAIALGEAPRNLDGILTPSVRILLPPRQLSVGLPSELAKRRPDILSAEAKLHAATAEIGAAEADFYPRITLIGSFGFQSRDEADLGHWNSRQFSVGPSIYLPIFEGGRLKRTLELKQARQKNAAIEFRATVLRAWHEVDNALNVRASEDRRHQALIQAYEQAHEALNAAEQSYRNGVSDYLSVLIAQRTALNNQLELSNSSTSMSLAMVSLYKALGGGWNPQQGLEP